MRERSRQASAGQAVGRRFVTTRWSEVVAAGQTPTAASRDALSRLCEAYWQPLYSYVRRWGYEPDQAEDLTQEFFARLLEKHYLRAADPERGRFRTFLLAALKHFLANERDRAHAVKRGGRVAVVSLDVDTEAGGRRIEPADGETPERVFERQWAVTLLERSLGRLRQEARRAGRTNTLAILESYLTGRDDALSYAEAAARLEMSEGAVKVAVHRLRKRFGVVLREEIRETVDDAQQVDDEIRHLFRSLTGP